MTRDVFKYFKQVRSLQESTTSERAHELGYEYQSRGVWLDPRTNKKYKAQGTQFKEIPQKEVSQREPGKKEEPKTLGKFKQDATSGKPEPQSQPEPTALPQIPDGVSDKEFADAKAKEWTGGRQVSAKRKEFLKKVANTQVAMMKQPEEPEPEEEAPEGLDDLIKDVQSEPEEKTAEDFPGMPEDGFVGFGYCWMHHFKCHSARSCDTWAGGGPIEEDEQSAEWQEKSAGASGKK